MIKAMRKHAKYFYFLFFIVILSFIFWGVGGVGNDSGQREVIAEVGTYKITSQEFWEIHQRTARFYRNIYKDNFEEMMNKMNLEEKILNSLIDDYVLLISAQEMGIEISDEELSDAITRDPMFQKDGVFNEEVYVNRVSRFLRLSPEAYEKMKRQELAIKKMRRLIELSVDTAGIDNQVKVSGDEKIVAMVKQQILIDRKDKAVRSFIEGAKKNIKIVVHKELLNR